MTSNIKLGFRWMGLYQVKIVFLKGFYKLEEIDGIELKGTYTRNCLKKFIYKKDAFIPINHELESDLDKINSLDKSES